MARVNVESSLSLSNTCTRGNLYKLTKYFARLDVRKFFFIFRIFDIWYSLPNDI